MNAAKKGRKKRERTRSKGNIIGLSGRGEAGGFREGLEADEERKRRVTETELERGNKRILIRNLKNKIIRLPDSKCQLREGSRWRERESERSRGLQEEGKWVRGGMHAHTHKTFGSRQVGLE